MTQSAEQPPDRYDRPVAGVPDPADHRFAFGSYHPVLDGRPYDPDYEDENGSAHIRPCPACGAGTDEPCADDCRMVTGA